MAIKESDWKVFKRLRAVALERLSQRILDESQTICNKAGASPHERYLELYNHIQDRNRDIARAFDMFSRNSATLSLLGIRSLGLLTDEELAEFSEEIRASSDPNW